MRTVTCSLLGACCLLLSACETAPKAAALPEPTYEQALNNTFNSANYYAVGELMKRHKLPASVNNSPGSLSAPPYSSASASNSAPFIVATLVNIDQLEQSSTLGRLISEQVASRMTQLGYDVVELKVRNGIYMKRNEGEFMLTREIKEVASAHKAQAVIVGTYAESATMVYINLKLVNPTSSIILAAYDYALPMDNQIRSMMRKRVN